MVGGTETLNVAHGWQPVVPESRTVFATLRKLQAYELTRSDIRRTPHVLMRLCDPAMAESNPLSGAPPVPTTNSLVPFALG